MSNEPMPSHGVMEGLGAYNKYAKLPAGGAALALPLLERAASDEVSQLYYWIRHLLWW